MGKYAQGTTVSVSRSVAEIEKIMERFGVDTLQDFTQIKRAGQYQCYWQIDGVTFTAQVDTRDMDDEREIRRMWRVIVQHIKAQLVAVDEGWLDPKLALAPFLMLSDGTMGKDALAKQLADGDGLQMPQLSLSEGTTEVS